MQYSTETYREEQKEHERGRSYVWVYLGLINQDAQRNAYISSDFSGSESQLYSNPDTSSYVGVTSSESDGSITFTFGDLYEISLVGLTLTFGDVYPTSFTVTNGTTTESFDNTETSIEIESQFDDCHTLTITPTEMSDGSTSLILKSILFGLGLQYTNNELINTSRTTSINHISIELPQKQFTFTIDNYDKTWNRDNPYGYSAYLQEQQICKYEYGRELSDGTIYKIAGGKTYLKTWSSTDEQAKFTTVGYLDFIEDTYYKGQYYEDGISLSDLAEDVLEDAGIEDYELDSCLSNIYVHNPLPVDTHKACLQIIANAGRCILYEDRNGNVCIRSTILPSVIGSVTTNGETSYSNANQLFAEGVDNYGTLEADYVVADGSYTLIPESDATYLITGYTSSEISDSTGAFDTNPIVTVDFQSQYTLSNMIINFGKVYPTEFIVRTYLDGSTVDEITVSSPQLITSISFDDTLIDQLEFEFTSTNAYQRIHMNYVELTGNLDYEITYTDLASTPIATSLELVKDVKIHVYAYSENDTTKQLVITDVVSGSNVVMLTNPAYDYTVTWEDGTTDGLVVDASGAYYVEVTAESSGTIIVSGNEYDISDTIYNVNLHETGNDKESSNELIDTLANAKLQGKWLKDYFDDDIRYNLTYRGEPCLDADDVVLLENNFVANNMIRIESENLSTSTGMSLQNAITARRVSYQVSATVSKAIVGRFKVGEVLEE